jgi:hypothetical protein
MCARLLTLPLLFVAVVCPSAQAAELSVSGFKLSDPQFLTNIEVFLSDVPGVVGAEARTADGTNITLMPSAPGQFFLFLEPFATFDGFRAATVGNWQLTIEFAGGAAVYDFVVNDFRMPFTEADFPPAPTVLLPTDGTTGVGPTPTFMWDPGGLHGVTPLESLFVNVYSLVDPTVFAMEGSFGGGVTLASTEWTPPVVLPTGPATFLVQYETNENEDANVGDPVFNAAASTIADPGIVWESSSGDLFARDLITFSVVPEPANHMLILLAAAMMASLPIRLVLTGERRARRHLAILDDRPVWLPGGLFTTLCRLVRARCTLQTGFVVESPLTIFRLRRLLEMGEVPRNEPSIIETGDGNEYRLAIDSISVDIEPSFAELPSPAFISRDDKHALLNLHVSDALHVKSV